MKRGIHGRKLALTKQITFTHLLLLYIRQIFCAEVSGGSGYSKTHSVLNLWALTDCIAYIRLAKVTTTHFRLFENFSINGAVSLATYIMLYV